MRALNEPSVSFQIDIPGLAMDLAYIADAAASYLGGMP